jgi:integrase
MANAWIYQRPEEVRDKGEDSASWYAGWYDYDGNKRGKSFGPGFTGKKNAERHKTKIENDLAAGTYQREVKKQWKDFRAEYERRILEGLAVATKEEALITLNHFERIAKPARMIALQTKHIDEYTAKRRQERGKKKGSLVSPATVNKELRHLKAAIRVAVDWGYLAKAPKFRMEKEPKHLPTYVNGDHFATIYAACDQATEPKDIPNVSPADWWRALLVFGYMTGWRIGDLLGLKRDDLDLEAGFAITRAETNKGKRDDKTQLHPVVVEHLGRIKCFDPHVFPWNKSLRRLHEIFDKIQLAAGINLPCTKNHEHTVSCHTYGFHDLRRAFATLNADKLTADALQKLMRHKSYTTTQRYINLSRQMEKVTESLHVPEFLKKKG